MGSVFMDKSIRPTEADLEPKLQGTYLLWNTIKSHLSQKAPAIEEEWNFPGKNYGWSFRLKIKKRNIIYFIPDDGSFRVAFVFGQKAFEKILESNVAADIKSELQQARVYAEGRGISIEVNGEPVLADIFTLIDIKMSS